MTWNRNLLPLIDRIIFFINHNHNCSKGHNISYRKCAPLLFSNILLYKVIIVKGLEPGVISKVG